MTDKSAAISRNLALEILYDIRSGRGVDAEDLTDRIDFELSAYGEQRAIQMKKRAVRAMGQVDLVRIRHVADAPEDMNDQYHIGWADALTLVIARIDDLLMVEGYD